MIERTPDTPPADRQDSGQPAPPAGAPMSGVAAVSAPPLTAREAAEVAGVSERTIRRAIARGELPAGKHAGAYRIAPVDLATWQDRPAGAADTGHQRERTAAKADRTDRQPPAARRDTPDRADTGQAAGVTAAEFGPLAEVIAHQGAELARLAAAAALWQERARVLEGRLLALEAGDAGQDAPSGAPAPLQAAEAVEPAADPSVPWWKFWERWG